MKNNIFVTTTYYHLIYSIIYAQKLADDKTLYIVSDYLKVDETLVERVKDTKVFDNVYLISEMEVRNTLFEKLEKIEKLQVSKDDSQVNKKMFDQILLPYYESKILINDDDDVYVFNNKLLSYYYIFTKSDNIIIVEEGYRSTKLQKVHRFRSRFLLLTEYLDNGYVDLDFKNQKIKKIIGSMDIDELSQEDFLYKYTTLDFKDLITENKTKYRDQLALVFDSVKISENEKSSLIITQPLTRVNYCYLNQQFLLYKRMIKEALITSDKVYIKIHPADTNIYESLVSDNVCIIADDFPIEMLIFEDVIFEATYTFGSTSLEIIDNTKEKIRIFRDDYFQYSDVVEAIKDYIKDEKINIGVVSKNVELAIIFEKLNSRKKTHYSYMFIDTNIINDDLRNISLELKNSSVDFFIIDDENVLYNDLLFRKIEEFMSKKIVDIFVFSIEYSYKSRLYKQISEKNRNFLTDSFFDKMLGINLIDKVSTTDFSWKSLMFEDYKKSYLTKASTVISYDKFAEMYQNYQIEDFINISMNDKARCVQYAKDAEQENIINIGIDKYYLSTMLLINKINGEEVYDLERYLRLLDKEYSYALINEVICQYLNPKFIKVDLEKERKKEINSIKKIEKTTPIKKVKKKIKNVFGIK